MVARIRWGFICRACHHWRFRPSAAHYTFPFAGSCLLRAKLRSVVQLACQAQMAGSLYTELSGTQGHHQESKDIDPGLAMGNYWVHGFWGLDLLASPRLTAARGGWCYCACIEHKDTDKGNGVGVCGC